MVESSIPWDLIFFETWNTIYMVVSATFFGILLGLPLGIILTITARGHLKEHPWIHKILGGVVNIGRSFPFAILLVALIPFTRWIIGTSLGTTATIVPLSIAAAPFIARLVEAALNEVDREVIEAALVIGSTPWQIITRVLLPETLPSLISGITLTIINLISYSAIAGMVGGGGLGKVAILYGYQRFNPTLMIITVALMILLVQLTQIVGGRLAANISRKRGLSPHV